MPPPSDDRGADDGAVRSWLSVVRAYHLCSDLIGARLTELGTKTSEHEILINLRREPGLSQQTLAARCFTAKSHISGLLGDLEARGLIRRHPDPADGRVKRLALTEAGARVAERTAAVQAGVVALMTDGMTAAELKHLSEVMAAVSGRLEQALSDVRSQS